MFAMSFQDEPIRSLITNVVTKLANKSADLIQLCSINNSNVENNNEMTLTIVKICNREIHVYSDTSTMMIICE